MVMLPDPIQEALQREMGEAEARLGRLEQQCQGIIREIEGLRAVIVGYREVMAFRTTWIDARPQPLPGFGGNGFVPSSGRAPGNRAPDMPPRDELFKTMSIEAAFLTLAAGWNGAHHADEYVRRVWIITNDRELRRAKRTANSYLAKMAKRGALRKVAPNTYEAVKASEVKQETPAAR